MQRFMQSNEQYFEPNRENTEVERKKDSLMIESQLQPKNQSVNLELIKSQFDILNAQLKESIKEQVRKIAEDRDQKLEQSLENKEKSYLKKMDEVCQKIESQISSQKEIVSSLIKQTQIQFTQKEEVRKEEAIKNEDISRNGQLQVPVSKVVDIKTEIKEKDISSKLQ